MREVGFLEIVIEVEGIKMGEENVKGVLDWLTPKEVKLLGEEGSEMELDRQQEEAFKELKERVMKELVLAALDLGKKIRMEFNTLTEVKQRRGYTRVQ